MGQQHGRSPQILTEKGPSVRNDFQFAFNKGGRHDLNVGGEYVYSDQPIFLGINSNGTLDVQGGPIPANIEQLFPVWNDISTWNLNALSPIARFYSAGRRRLRVEQPGHELRRLGAGRLDDGPPDAQSRRALRHHQGHLR